MPENTAIEFLGEISLQCIAASSRAALYEEKAFRECILGELSHFVNSGGELVSFDVFDTVLLRNTKCETRRFLEIAERCSSLVYSHTGRSIEPAVMLIARLGATEISYRLSQPVRGCREGSLNEIHLGVARRLNLPDELAKQFVAEEVRYEMETLTLNPWFRSAAKMIQTSGLKITFISDMYMSGKDIAELIDGKASTDFGPNSVYSSGDLKISKKSGLLYDYVAQRFGVETGRAFHLGDNIETDYRCARSRGWTALYLPHTVSEKEAIARDEQLVLTEIEDKGFDLKLLADHR